MEYFSTIRKITKVEKGEKLEKDKSIKRDINSFRTSTNYFWFMEIT